MPCNAPLLPRVAAKMPATAPKHPQTAPNAPAAHRRTDPARNVRKRPPQCALNSISCTGSDEYTRVNETHKSFSMPFCVVLFAPLAAQILSTPPSICLDASFSVARVYSSEPMPSGSNSGLLDALDGNFFCIPCAALPRNARRVPRIPSSADANAWREVPLGEP